MAKAQKPNGKSNGKNPQGIFQLIGNTPIVELTNLTKSSDARLFAKLESHNPAGSVKDRVAYAMIRDAETRGLLKPGGTVVEATSGNTGIALAMICAAKKYKFIAVLPYPDYFLPCHIMSHLGAKIVFTARSGWFRGAVARAKEIAEKTPNAYFCNQFSNPVNAKIHKETTAREILEQMNGDVDAFIAGVGTGGTISGVAEVLKKYNPKVQIIAVEPKTAAVLSSSSATVNPHYIEGIGAGFIPNILQTQFIDRILCVEDNNAWETSRRLARQEGLMVGVSSGATCYAALKIAKSLGSGKRILTIFPDAGVHTLCLAPWIPSEAAEFAAEAYAPA